MHNPQIAAGSTNVILHVFIEDTRVEDGSGLTGLVFNSSGLSAYYIVAGDSGETAISLVTTTLGSHTDGGFVLIDDTNMPGWYELQIPDACVAAGFQSCSIILKGAAYMAATNIQILQASEGAASADIADAVWDEARAGHVVAGSFGEHVLADITEVNGDATCVANLANDYGALGYSKTNSEIGGVASTVDADVIRISGDTTAANNLELMYDGTGYPGGTIKLGVDIVAISGDATAADNLERDYDGTGYSKSASSIRGVEEVTSVIGIDADAINASALAADAVAEIADGVWDEALSGHLTSGTTGDALNGAGAEASPNLPGEVVSVVSSTVIETDLTGANSNQYKGRQIVFTSGTLDGLSALILGYDPATSYLTHVSFTGTPGIGDTFVIH
jgi:hypothetical protein